MEGQFEDKDLVEIHNLEGVKLGVGRADCSAKELRLSNQGAKSDKFQSKYSFR